MNVGDLLVGNHDEGILQHSFHALHIGCHVRRNVTAVVLHAFNDFGIEAEGLALFNGDCAVLANGLHSLGNLLANNGITSGNGTNIGNLSLRGNGRCIGLDGFDNRISCLLDTAADAQSISTGGHVLQAFGHNDICQKRCGSGAVASNIVGLNGNFANQLSTHVLNGIFQLNFLSNGHAIVRDKGSAVGLLQSNVATLGAKRYLNSSCQFANACGQTAAGISFEFNIFSHSSLLSVVSAFGAAP